MSNPYYQDDSITLHHGDCLDVLAGLPDNSVEAVITDPPYGLEFMGKDWDAPWHDPDVNTDAGFRGGGISATRSLPSFTGSTNPKCLVCKGTRRGRRDGTAKVAVCLCEDGGHFPNVRAVEMHAFQLWCTAWATECLRILKPGGHLLAFGGSRTWHRLSSGIEDAGFEIRDSIAWLYGSGFPKSMDVSKAIASTELGYGGNSVAQRKATMGDNYVQSGRQGNRDGAGRRDTGLAEHTLELTERARVWQGWGTALKPAFEPIVVARKPLAGTVAANVLAHGTGALNIDGCRIATTEDCRRNASGGDNGLNGEGAFRIRERRAEGQAERDGRWPTNVVLDGDQAEALDRQTGVLHSGTMRAGTERQPRAGGTIYGADTRNFTPADTYGDSGGASRFFPVFRYEAKAPTSERPNADGVQHPTVKPLDLMRWLVRLVTPVGAVVLEPFAGSGTTAEACVLEDRQCIAVEREADYLPLIVSRLRKPVQQGLFGLEAGA
ncbi:putative methyltransferase [Mycobacteroides abscessus subsp. abscessus]|uniref:DNA-methyltransferase n=1 Tax=Mycobacteroides abscessus TaxID=36809 RepID=UPI00092B3993|nr:DNA methyltransferase [Mycobacteroides abscessus]SIE60307.1 putative methyltransferase [Mycobacteroides abscessus subsp. abscessus]SKQ03934.1 DNA methylase N-4/N-6 [Mycobacteroides abscessus subsp. massiliense]SKV27922.1 putative methyltransferase [Mycobacteroides abscessus subsp. abscessus]